MTDKFYSGPILIAGNLKSQQALQQLIQAPSAGLSTRYLLARRLAHIYFC
jgi:hypothetical protein